MRLLRKNEHSWCLIVTSFYVKKTALLAAILPIAYNECGLEGLEHYVENSPLVIFEKAEQEAFEWAAYILWENNISVSIDDESASWYVEKISIP